MKCVVFRAFVSKEEPTLTGILFGEERDINNAVHAFRAERFECKIEETFGRFIIYLPEDSGYIKIAYALPANEFAPDDAYALYYLLHRISPIIHEGKSYYAVEVQKSNFPNIEDMQ